MKHVLLTLLFVVLGCFAPDVTIHEGPCASAVPSGSAPDVPVNVPDAGDEDAATEVGDAAAPACVPCSQALAGDAAFEDESLGRVYDGACEQGAALWIQFYDWACATAKPCHLDCIDSFCMTGFPSGACKGCFAQHVTEPPYDACASDL